MPKLLSHRKSARQLWKEQQLREKILVAARHLFAKRGFHPVTMAQIVKAAGHSLETVQRYFPQGKIQIFIESRRGCDPEETLAHIMGKRMARMISDDFRIKHDTW